MAESHGQPAKVELPWLLVVVFEVLFSWHPSLAHFPTYIRDWIELRRLIQHYGTVATNRIRHDLYYYDMSVEYMTSYSGLMYVLMSTFVSGLVKMLQLKQEKNTENNHSLQQFYQKDYIIRDIRVQNPTKWTMNSLRSQPFISDEQVSNLSNNRVNVSQLIQDLSLLRKNCAEMREEFTQMEQNKERRMHSHPDSKTEVNKGGKWDWHFIYGVHGFNPALQEHLPKTVETLNELQLLNTAFGFAFFSRIEPGTLINRHTGSSNLRWRIQLCLQCDPLESDAVELNHLQCGVEKRGWKQGELILFDDSFQHNVRYDGLSGHSRLVFILDLWHPDLTPVERDILSQTVFSKFGRFETDNRNAKKLD